MINKTTLQFLRQLRKNNHKDWFDENRKAYEAAKADFAGLVGGVLKTFAAKDPLLSLLQPKDCVFRINRDVRFSKNKDPYKTNLAMYLVAGGKKSMLAGFYCHLEPDGKSFIGGGLYGADAEQLKKVRQEIDYNWKEFEKIIKAKSFVSTFGDLSREEGMALQREPKGYEKDNPAIHYLKLKSFVATHPLADADFMGEDATKKINNSFTALKPLVQFLNEALTQ
ncbi:MAG: DUF2461 domain-containing protein [Sphingobacteriia bacterium]|nr:MAG: DUF2461 domain-containing protein [Sphingobacteriia bacterium]